MRDSQARDELKIGIVGLGAIGTALVKKFAQGRIPGAALTAVAVRRADHARAILERHGLDVQIAEIAELPALTDVVIECAPPALLATIAKPVLSAGKTLVVLSVAQLLANQDLISLAEQSGGQIIVPTGALIGLDAVSAAAEGNITSVRMITRKPIAALSGAAYLVANGIEIEGISEPKLIFSGSAREAAKGFPTNVNVAAALSLAGIGPDRTQVEIWADPTVTRNTHKIEVEADSASFDMTIRNLPSENPRTGRITALSVIATIRRLNNVLRVGT